MNPVGAFSVFAIIAAFAPSFSSGASLVHHRVARQLAVPREFQNVNVENYLKNPRAVKFQLNCVIYDGPCDSIGKFLKNNIHGWLNTQCENCDESQKKQAGKLIGFFQKSYPKEWNDAVRKFKGDITSEEEQRFEDELGLKLRADESTAGSKLDITGLKELVKEAKETLKTTKAPLVFTNDGVVLTTPKGFTLPPDVKIDSVSSSTPSNTDAPSSSTLATAVEPETVEPSEEATTNVTS